RCGQAREAGDFPAERLLFEGGDFVHLVLPKEALQTLIVGLLLRLLQLTVLALARSKAMRKIETKLRLPPCHLQWERKVSRTRVTSSIGFHWLLAIP
ncbi:MAG: hypothetical protein BRC54_06225, partial [Cyanobacteria bacterium SW_7_48_12]